MTIWNELLGNQVLISAVLGWTVAQFLKTVIDMVLNRSFNPERIFGSGGMPSSHSATVCALTTASGMKYTIQQLRLFSRLPSLAHRIVHYDHRKDKADGKLKTSDSVFHSGSCCERADGSRMGARHSA